MAFIFNKFDESEEEFDAEQERYDMLRQKLFQGQSLKYDDLEELMAAAKEKNDKKVIMTLKNVVTDPEEEQTVDTVESTPEDMMADFMESGKINKESLDESLNDESFTIDDFFDDGIDEYETELGTGLATTTIKLNDMNILIADEIEFDSNARNIILKYDSKGWYEGIGWAENIKSDIVHDLNKLKDEYRKFTSSNFLFKYNPASIKQALDNAATKIKDENEDVIYQKQNRFGDWDYVADCIVYIPYEIVQTAKYKKPVNEEDSAVCDETEESVPEEKLPESVIFNAVETLRRMY